MSARCAFLSSESGTALLEFALSLPLLMLIVMGVVNYTLRIQQAMQITEAASAGAAFGAIPGNQANVAGMQAAATRAAPAVTNLTVNATVLRSCTPGGGNVASSTSCSGYGTPIQYVQVTASAAVPALFAWPGVSSSITVARTATFRVPWSE